MYVDREILGWRKANDEEQKVIQGLVLSYLKKNRGVSKIGTMIFCLLLFFCMIGIPSVLSGIWNALVSRQGDLLFAEGTLLFIIVIIIGSSIKNIYSSVFNRKSQKIEESVRKGEILVNDVIVSEIISTHGTKGAVLDYWALLEDKHGNKYNKEIMFLAQKQEVCKEEVLLIRVGGGLKREFIIPKESRAKDTWKLGREMYKKYTK